MRFLPLSNPQRNIGPYHCRLISVPDSAALGIFLSVEMALLSAGNVAAIGAGICVILSGNRPIACAQGTSLNTRQKAIVQRCWVFKAFSPLRQDPAHSRITPHPSQSGSCPSLTGKSRLIDGNASD